MQRYLFAGLLLTITISPVSALPPTDLETLERSTEVLDELAAIPLKGIPPKLLAEAQGVAIIPRVVKVGFLFAGRGGHGIVMSKDKNGNWSNPVFINLGGASVGFQAGVEATDVVLVFRDRKSLERLLEGKGKVTLGADAAIAAGPVGRMAAAATDGKLEAEILSYSRSRGLFAGVSLDGAIVHADANSNAMFRKNVEAQKAAEGVKRTLMVMSQEKPIAPPPPVLGPPVVIPSRPSR